MKRILWLSALLLACFAVFSANKPAIISEILREHVERKIADAQQIIKFSDEHAEQLKKVELEYLQAVVKAENCRCCNARKKIEKLKAKKYQTIEKFLPPDEFIKYKAIDNQEVKKHPLWAK